MPVELDVDGRRQVTGAPVDAAGALGGDPARPVLARAPLVARGDRPFSVVGLQRDQPVAIGTSRVTALDVGLSPRRSRPSRRVVFRGRGFTGPGPVYAHYRFRGRSRARVTFRPRGACGGFTARRRQIPVSRPGTGRWTVQFDQQRRYSRSPRGVFVRLTIVVTRSVRLGRARMTAAGGAG